MEIHNVKDSIAYCEAIGLSKCFKAYAEYCNGEFILQIGFNENSGYTYIALENGVTIASMLGNRVEYIVSEEDEEKFYSSYKTILNKFK